MERVLVLHRLTTSELGVILSNLCGCLITRSDLVVMPSVSPTAGLVGDGLVGVGHLG